MQIIGILDTTVQTNQVRLYLAVLSLHIEPHQYTQSRAHDKRYHLKLERRIGAKHSHITAPDKFQSSFTSQARRNVSQFNRNCNCKPAAIPLIRPLVVCPNDCNAYPIKPDLLRYQSAKFHNDYRSSTLNGRLEYTTIRHHFNCQAVTRKQGEVIN